METSINTPLCSVRPNVIQGLHVHGTVHSGVTLAAH